ncbi:Na+/H+ antiporter NhaA [Hufsiella ginkgonis]|uniref:Na(+)/H(+) antiporter NhaA n=1 Tax=Hufsiella ginkgonis TaxID=2695274 RepID=A0A7K1XY68_9SPHI|nr:Na+/H+ antiporter NhaA [Hufsiella ginkgonis]MXV15892.1 Na+/H+ antiporter NhaA [Hufsiella ginkgonis]
MRKQVAHAFRDFFRSEQTGGLILFFCVILSLGIANSPFGDAFAGLLSCRLYYPVLSWINDGLMAVFFLLVGLEIKREMRTGELSTPQKAAMPVLAALGGMLFPAAVFAFINQGAPSRAGWGIPMATDIAFALAVIGLLGKRVPASLKVFLAALAIADDLGAIIVIAVFYTDGLHADHLLYAAAILLVLIIFNLLKVKRLYFYLLPGILLWYLIHHSGIHATIAGVLLALVIPAHGSQGTSPLVRLEHILNKPVGFIIMPLFALANTNIRYEPGMFAGLSSPLGLGIMAGLLLGKPVGIVCFSWLAVKLKLGALPHRAGWIHMAGTGLLAGIGFTMSVFIALLSFNDAGQQATAKFAILVTSAVAGTCGYLLLTRARTARPKAR